MSVLVGHLFFSSWFPSRTHVDIVTIQFQEGNMHGR
jgi:hypothetical protein